MDNLIKMASEVYEYHGQIGQESYVERFCNIVRDTENSNVWSSNKITNVRLSDPKEIPELMAIVEQWFSAHEYRIFSIDPSSPDFFTAYLALNRYEEQIPILQMVLTGDIKCPSNDLEIFPVSSEEHWKSLSELVMQDHMEGGRTHGAEFNSKITKGIMDGYKKKASECQFYLGAVDGVYCSYGSGLKGPNDMGMVEDVFTLPEYRKQGHAGNIIAKCVEFSRKSKSDPVLIGSHVTDSPKYLYSKLGFEPVYLARSFMKNCSR